MFASNASNIDALASNAASSGWPPIKSNPRVGLLRELRADTCDKPTPLAPSRTSVHAFSHRRCVERDRRHMCDDSQPAATSCAVREHVDLLEQILLPAERRKWGEIFAALPFRRIHRWTQSDIIALSSEAVGVTVVICSHAQQKLRQGMPWNCSTRFACGLVSQNRADSRRWPSGVYAMAAQCIKTYMTYAGCRWHIEEHARDDFRPCAMVRAVVSDDNLLERVDL